MAHLLNVEAVTVAHPARTVLDAVSLGLDDGDRVGVVGFNGAGKSTLLRVLAREQPPDTGRVTYRRGLTVGVLSQSDAVEPGTSARRAILGQIAEHAWASQSR